MNIGTFVYEGREYPQITLHALVVGTGAAGYAAADSLFDLGVTDVAIVTEGVNMGTSRNTGSDKQTYYKLTLSGSAPDSVGEMAQSLFEGGARDGDTALCEAALSARCFYKLCDLGVPFPHNSYGEYVGYKTDHDPRARASSCGPLTSKLMTEALERSCRRKNIPVLDGLLVVSLLRINDRICGVVCMDEEGALSIVRAQHVIYATGGPAGIYSASVYPESQTGATGIALEAGILGANLCESQYGIASTDFRWNLSGTYQQVLPRYISRDKNGGDEREFLADWFPDAGSMANAVFLKGYQWPFDVRKIENYGSSLVDILVYNETVLRGRDVFLDFRSNPSNLDCDGGLNCELLPIEAREYLLKSDALFGKPIDRLRRMNPGAIELYSSHGIDLEHEPLRIAVCAQHNNGGLYCDCFWRSNLKGFYPVGEVCGNFGLYRPGGSALNATQVGALRAAQYIAHDGSEPETDDQFSAAAKASLSRVIRVLSVQKDAGTVSCADAKACAGEGMTACGAHIRNLSGAEEEIRRSEQMLAALEDGTLLSDGASRPQDAFRLRDILITRKVYLAAVADHIRSGFGSRGSYLVCDAAGVLAHPDLPDVFRFRTDAGGRGLIRIYAYDAGTGEVTCSSRPVKPVPMEDNWFETVWEKYRTSDVFCL